MALGVTSAVVLPIWAERPSGERVWELWMDEIRSRQFEAMGNQSWLVFTGESPETRVS